MKRMLVERFRRRSTWKRVPGWSKSEMKEMATAASLFNPVATAVTQRRYQRLAPYYDSMELRTERRFRPWRERLWEQVRGPKVIEVGVGTGKNMPYYPAGLDITAIDLTPGM